MRDLVMGVVIRARARGTRELKAMSKKKQQRNGFFYYMLDMQQEFKQKGRNMPMKDISMLAGSSWSRLSDAQKHLYNLRAKSEKSGSTSGPSETASLVKPAVQDIGKRDCMGSLIAERPNPEAEMLQRRERECQEIRALFPPGKRVTLENFYMMDVQSLCHIAHKPDHKYLPCEVGVVRYSLNHGIASKFHRFILPGPIPIGYRYQAQSTSESTNQIPVEGAPEAVGDYRKLLGELEQYLACEGEAIHHLPPVFARREFVECVEWSLQWLADRAGVTNRITRVYELESLIGELVSHSDADVTVSPFVVEEMLKTSTYEHDSCTRCSYHEELDCSYCSLGISHTYCYVMTELICPLYTVAITRNHLSIIPAASRSSNKVVMSHPPRNPGRGGRGVASRPPTRPLGRASGFQGHRRTLGTGRGITSSELWLPPILGRGQANSLS